jgi:hypothetical protein
VIGDRGLSERALSLKPQEIKAELSAEVPELVPGEIISHGIASALSQSESRREPWGGPVPVEDKGDRLTFSLINR